MPWPPVGSMMHPVPCRVAALREAAQPEPSALAAAPEWAAEREGVLRAWDARLEALWGALQPGTLAIVVSGQGDTAYTRYFQVCVGLLAGAAFDLQLPMAAAAAAAMAARIGWGVPLQRLSLALSPMSGAAVVLEAP